MIKIIAGLHFVFLQWLWDTRRGYENGNDDESLPLSLLSFFRWLVGRRNDKRKRAALILEGISAFRSVGRSAAPSPPTATSGCGFGEVWSTEAWKLGASSSFQPWCKPQRVAEEAEILATSDDWGPMYWRQLSHHIIATPTTYFTSDPREWRLHYNFCGDGTLNLWRLNNWLHYPDIEQASSRWGLAEWKVTLAVMTSTMQKPFTRKWFLLQINPMLE